MDSMSITLNQKDTAMFIYYVYAYIRKSDNTPYYIGKGKENRAYEKHGRIKLPKDKSKIIFLEKNLSEIGAFALERRYIRWYGKKIDNSGILLNLAEGGEGSSGYIPSQERRKQISEQMKGNAHNKGKFQSIESNIARSKALKGRIISEEHRLKISQALKGRIVSKESIKKSKITKINKKITMIGNKNPMYGKRGELSPLKLHKWWTNGINNIFSPVCPQGFSSGRIMQKHIP